jgi:hypothetical protein
MAILRIIARARTFRNRFNAAGKHRKIKARTGLARPRARRYIPPSFRTEGLQAKATAAKGDVGAGWSSPVARQAHNLKVVGSNPAPAPNFSQ